MIRDTTSAKILVGPEWVVRVRWVPQEFIGTRALINPTLNFPNSLDEAN
jgi:hypothetical protein